MKALLIVIDMQNDFITGALGSSQAQQILPAVKSKINEYKQNCGKVIFTRDTHYENYLTTQEGKYLSVVHCVEGTDGHSITSRLNTDGCELFDKHTFGSLELAKLVTDGNFDVVELCGLCTDICVISNALILKAQLPETKIIVDARCCAGVTEESHNAALLAMKMCQVDVMNEDEDHV